MATRKSKKGTPDKNMTLAWANEIDQWNDQIEQVNGYLRKQEYTIQIDPLSIEAVQKSGYTWPNLVNSAQAYEHGEALQSLTEAYMQCLAKDDMLGVHQIEELIQSWIPDNHELYWPTGVIWARSYEPHVEKVLKRFPNADLEILYSNDNEILLSLYLRTIALYKPEDIKTQYENIAKLMAALVTELNDQNSGWKHIQPRMLVKACDALVRIRKELPFEPLIPSDELVAHLCRFPIEKINTWHSIFNMDEYLPPFEDFDVSIDVETGRVLIENAMFVGPERYLTYCLLKAWSDNKTNTIQYLLENIPEFYPEMHKWGAYSLWVEAAHLCHSKKCLDSDLLNKHNTSTTLMISDSFGTIPIIADQVRRGVYNKNLEVGTSLDLPKIN